jgi:acetyl esterase/lipase
MTTQYQSMQSPVKSWKPRGIWAWLLTLVAVLLALCTVAPAYCMAFPVQFVVPGFLGLDALLFPLHVLVVTVLALLLWWVAKPSRARLARTLFGFVAILTAIMGLTPAFAMWQRARQLGVPLSLGNYLENATRMNDGHPPQLNRSVSYGTAKDGASLQLDVWSTGLPNSGPLRPAVVFLHGGGWIVGNRSERPDWNRWLNKLGYEVFDVEYRMPPPVRWQDEIGDVKAAVGWVAAHAADYHVDPARISIMGESAGGNLALLAAYSMGDPGLPASTGVVPVAIRSVIDLYGPTEMAKLYDTTSSPGFVQYSESTYIGGIPEEFPERYHALSPLYHINAQTPPTITFQGTMDRLVPMEQATMLDAALTKAGVAHELYLLPANDHGFDINWGGFGTQIARTKIQDFLQSH